MASLKHMKYLKYTKFYHVIKNSRKIPEAATGGVV